jgi:hypothetical protein
MSLAHFRPKLLTLATAMSMAIGRRRKPGHPAKQRIPYMAMVAVMASQ